MLSFLKKLQNFCPNCQNHAPHFHTNFFSREYFPIYVSFVIFIIVLTLQHVINFKLEQVIFDVLLGMSFALINYLAKKYAKYAQLLFTGLFMFGTIMLDKLFIQGLNQMDMLFLGIYICLIYYNVIKGSNTILSNFAFCFMLLYLSGVFMIALTDLITFFGNFTICLLQSYLTWTDYKHKLLENNKQINEKKKWMHIFNKVFPGVTLLFKIKAFDNQNNTKTLVPKLKDHLQIEFVNILGQERYKITDNPAEIERFLSDIIIIPRQNQQQNINNNQSISMNIHDNIKIKNISNKLNLNDLILSSSNENFNPISSENMTLGFYKDKSKKMKINLASFEWNTEKLLLLHLDDENLEEEIKKLQENDVKKNELLASVTHDLRSPLNGILAFINNAKNNENKIDRDKMLHYADINGKLLMSLINDILDYSSFLNGKFNLIKESFSLDSLINEVIDLMEVQASAKNIKLKVEKEIEENLQIVSDARRIKQILINLIGNSIKFTMKGFIKLKVIQTKYKNIIKFSVKDSGVGIKKEILDKLCTPYATFDTDGGLNKYGIGLGLNICKKLISLLGPKEILNITSEYMIGTKISFFIFLDMNNRKNTCEMVYLANKEKIEIKKYHSGEIQFPLGPMLSNFSPKILKTKASDKSFKNGKETPLSASATIKKHATFSKFELNKPSTFSKFEYNLISKSDQNNDCKKKQKKKDFVIELQKLDYSSFGSLDDESDFEEKNSDNNFGQVYNFENQCLIASTSINDKTPLILPYLNESVINKTFNVLIADDNPFNIFVITTYLKKIENIKLLYDNACNGVEAVCKFKEKNKIDSDHYYNLIFMDCLMPIKNGYEASVEIKSLIKSKEYHEAVIIGVTGLSGEEEDKKCLDNGMDGFIGKPISEQQCLDLIYFYVNNEV